MDTASLYLNDTSKVILIDFWQISSTSMFALYGISIMLCKVAFYSIDIFRRMLFRDKVTMELPSLITVEISSSSIADRAAGRRIAFDLGIDDYELSGERFGEKKKKNERILYRTCRQSARRCPLLDSSPSRIRAILRNNSPLSWSTMRSACVKQRPISRILHQESVAVNRLFFLFSLFFLALESNCDICEVNFVATRNVRLLKFI